MRLLLDECVPKRLGRAFVDHDVVHVTEAGWSGLTNGELLRLAAADFDAFVTVDQGIEFQQNISQAPLPILLLVAPSNEIDALRALVPRALQLLPRAKPGQLIRVAA